MSMINAVGWLMGWQCTVKDSSSVLRLDPALVQFLTYFRWSHPLRAPVFELRGKQMHTELLMWCDSVTYLVS